VSLLNFTRLLKNY